MILLTRYGLYLSTARYLQHSLRAQLRYNSSSRNRWLNRQNNDHFTREAKTHGLKSRAAFKLMEIDDRYGLFKKNSGQRVLDLGFAPGAWSQIARKRIGNDGMVMGVDILPCAPPKGVYSLQANILSKKTHDLIRLCFARHIQLNKHDELHKDHGYLQHMLEEELNHLQQTEQYRELFSTKDISNAVERYPIDVILSDMYEPWPQTSGFWNNLTNVAYDRMANTTGVAIKDHLMSMDLCDAALIVAIDLLKPGGSFACKLYTGEEDMLLEARMKQVFHKVHRFKPLASRNESKELYFIGLRKHSNIDKIKVFMDA